MKVYMYAILDEKVGFLAPQVEVNDAVALRNFSVQVNTNETIKRNSIDFAFYSLASFDTESGLIEAIVPPKQIATASNVKEFKDGE